MSLHLTSERGVQFRTIAINLTLDKGYQIDSTGTEAEGGYPDGRRED